MAKIRYDVLCDDLKARREDQRRRENLAYDVARNFRAAFASFLGVDDTDPDDRLVFLWQLAFEDGAVVVVHKGEERTGLGYVLPDEQHNWVFAIHVRLNAEDFVCQCRIHLGEASTEIRIADRPESFPLTLEDESTYQPALQALYEHLRRWLQWRPDSGQPQPQMGFDLMRP